MSRSRKRKQTTNRAPAGNITVGKPVAAITTTRRSAGTTRSTQVQNLAFLLMVALGFWGLTIFFVLFYVADPNHYLYGAIAGLTAVGWTVWLARRWLTYRQRV